MTSEEKTVYSQKINESLKLAGINNFAVITHPCSFPPYEKNAALINSGVGCPTSSGAKEYLLFLKNLFGANAVQNGPEGIINKESKSPYSGGSFSLGYHMVDPGYLMDLGLINNSDFVKIASENSDTYLCDYDNFFEKSQYEGLLETAYQNFSKLLKTNSKKYAELNAEFQEFIKNESDIWLNSDAVFSILEKENNTSNFMLWQDIQKNLNVYRQTPHHPKFDEAQNLFKSLSSSYEAQKYKFIQFIAYKQKLEMKKFAEKNGLSLIADVSAGFSKADVWKIPEAFFTNIDNEFCAENPFCLTLGCTDNNLQIDWDLPVLNADRLSAKQILKRKFEHIVRLSDGFRIDAAWSYIMPHVFNHYAGETNPNSFENLDYDYKFTQIIMEIIEKKVKNESLVFAENLGTDEGVKRARALFEKFKIRQIQMSIWGFHPKDNKKSDWHCLGTHDNLPLRNWSNNPAEEFAKLFTGPKFALGAENVEMTFIDLFGRTERMNNPRDPFLPANWAPRVPSGFEEEYYRQAAKNLGLNMAEIMLKVFTDDDKKGFMTKDKQNPFYEKTSALKPFLEYFSGVLKTPEEPVSTKEADLMTELKENFRNFLKDKISDDELNNLFKPPEEPAKAISLIEQKELIKPKSAVKNKFAAVGVIILSAVIGIIMLRRKKQPRKRHIRLLNTAKNV